MAFIVGLAVLEALVRALPILARRNAARDASPARRLALEFHIGERSRAGRGRPRAQPNLVSPVIVLAATRDLRVSSFRMSKR